MWAGGHQQPSANAQQWWPMSYNYQYQTPPAGKHCNYLLWGWKRILALTKCPLQLFGTSGFCCRANLSLYTFT